MGKRDRDAEGFLPVAPADAVVEAGPDVALGVFARKIYQSRRQRDKKFSVPGLFQDPAWDILLDLFISHVDNKYISVMSAGLAGQVPTSTALRWVWALEEARLVERRLDMNDKRRSFVFLSSNGLATMREILADISVRLQPQANEGRLTMLEKPP